jgi:uncharacterized protein
VSGLANKFIKPGQIVKVKVMEVDVKRQRIALTMRLDDVPGTGSRSGEARVDANAGTTRGPGGRRPLEPRRTPGREPQTGGAIAMALERAKLKK